MTAARLAAAETTLWQATMRYNDGTISLRETFELPAEWTVGQVRGRLYDIRHWARGTFGGIELEQVAEPQPDIIRAKVRGDMTARDGGWA